MAFRSSSKDRPPLRDSCAHPAVAIHTKQTTVHRTSAIFVFETLAATDYRGSAPSGQTAAAVHWRGLRAPDLIGGSTFVACLRDNGPRRSRLRDEVHLLFALQNSRHAPEIEETSMIHGIPVLTRSLSPMFTGIDREPRVRNLGTRSPQRILRRESAFALRARACSCA